MGERSDNLSNQEITRRFGTLSNYEKYRYQWALLCALINPTKKNKKIVRDMMLEERE